ncbi:MAG: glycerophosphodiester phosphodiesterase [Burkholderiales bacterium]|nr:glycerophosphodiester phosphodiesterase [Burkholderiales bacterium]
MTPWPYPKFFAHRGGGTLAPENTLAAMRTGHQHGYQAVEFDVKLSADGVAILMHDATLGRTSTGLGDVRDLAYDELARQDAGSWHSPQFAGERIPRFTEVAMWLQAQDMLANVEIKPCFGREVETGHLVGNLCRDLWLGQRVQPLVSSFSQEALTAARQVAPGLVLGFLVKDFQPEHVAVLESLKCMSLHCHHAKVAPSMIEMLHGLGYRLMVYTVNDADRAHELLSWGVDGIFTDSLDDMRATFPRLLGT